MILLHKDNSLLMIEFSELASSDHAPAVKSLVAGLARGNGRLIHISGTGVLNDFSNGFGNRTPKVYDDVAYIKEIISLPATALHRDVDEVVITSGIQNKVPTAIVCPPMIYGPGQGPLKKRSIQVPNLIEATLKRGRAFTVGEGNNIWDRMCLLVKALKIDLTMQD